MQKSADTKQQKKAHKSTIPAIILAAAGGYAVVPRAAGQLALSSGSSHGNACDAAFAEPFYACNISASVVDHMKFKEMVTTLKAASQPCKAPNRNKLNYGWLLDDTVCRLRHEFAPIRQAICRHGATKV